MIVRCVLIAQMVLCALSDNGGDENYLPSPIPNSVRYLIIYTPCLSVT